MEESSDPQPAGLEAAGAGRSGAAAPERVAVGAEHGCGSGPHQLDTFHDQRFTTLQQFFFSLYGSLQRFVFVCTVHAAFQIATTQVGKHYDGGKLMKNP